MQRAARTTAVAIALTTAFGITACGNSGAGDTSADAKQTITVWAMGAEGDKLGDVAKEYTRAHPNVTVKVTPVSWDVAHQKLLSAAAAGTLPDVAQMGGSYLGEFADLGVLEPVDTKVFHEKDFFPAGWQQGVVDGDAYGVPWYVDTRALYYRTDLAEKAGIDKAPATWPQLREAAARYQKAGSQWGLAIQPDGLDTVQSFYPFLYSAGGAILKDGKPVVNSPAAVKAFAEYGSYFSKGLAKKSVTPGYDPTKDFNTGAVPMFFSGPWIMTTLKEQYPGLDGKWAVARVPADRSSTSMAGGSSLVVSKDSGHKAASLKFIQYLTGTKGQADWFKRSGDLPANSSAWDSGKLAQDANLQVFRAQMEASQTSPALADWTEITSKVDSAIESVTQGKASPRAAADKAQSEIESLVKQSS